MDISWYCGIVAATIIAVVSHGGDWLQRRVVVSSFWEAGRVSALVVLRLWASSSCEAGSVDQRLLIGV